MSTTGESSTNLRQRTAPQDEQKQLRRGASTSKDKKPIRASTVVKKPWSCWKVTLVVLGSLIGFLFIIHFLPSYITPDYVRLASPPPLEGPLSKNELLTGADLFLETEILGAESMAFDRKTGVIYTGTSDGRVVAIHDRMVAEVAKLGEPPCGNVLEDEDNCGRPLGMRFDKQGRLLVADAYLGIHRIDVTTGKTELMCRNDSVTDGPAALFLNDVAIGDDGLIYVSDSSTKWQRRQAPILFFENQDHGRLLVCDPKTKKMKTLLTGLHFANGIQLSDDQSNILIVETGLARIVRYYLTGPKKGTMDIFADNLPGFGDNIRPSSSGGYWVGMAFVRSGDHYSLMDILGPLPAVRSLLGEITPPMFMLEMLPEHAMVIELDKSGRIIRSLQDTTASKISSVSEVLDLDGTLYLGSYHAPGLMMLKLK